MRTIRVPSYPLRFPSLRRRCPGHLCCISVATVSPEGNRQIPCIGLIGNHVLSSWKPWVLQISERYQAQLERGADGLPTVADIQLLEEVMYVGLDGRSG